MPLILYHGIKKEDVIGNPRCFFIYTESEKKEGGKVYMREAQNCLPLTISKAPSSSVEAQWTDSNYRENTTKFGRDVDKVVKYLDRRAIVFLESQFLQEEENSIMADNAPRTLKFIKNTISYLVEKYEPQYVKTD